MRTTRPPFRSAVVATLLAVTIAATTGCQGGGESTTPPDPLAEGVTLKDLPSYQPPEPSGDDQTNATPAPTPTIPQKLVARRFVFDRPSPKLAMAMSMVDEEVLPPEQRRLWRENGFGIGRLDRSRVKLLLANAPQPRVVDVFRVTNPASYRPVSLIKQGNGSDRIRLVRPDRSPRLIRRSAGEFQLLMKLLPPITEDEPTSIDLLPHHYQDLPSLLPRSQNDSFLEGRSFDGLRIEEPVDPDRVWVIWLRDPPAPQNDADSTVEGESDEGSAEGKDSEEATGSRSPQESISNRSRDSQQKEAAGQDAEAASDGPVSLAEAMLSGVRNDDPVQIVLLIGVRR